MSDLVHYLRESAKLHANEVETRIEAADLIERLRAELDALKSSPVPSIPEGYQLVPVEPTFKMQRAGMYTESNPDDPVSLTFREVTAIYKAMIAAAKEES
jgi:hypothetical protein